MKSKKIVIKVSGIKTLKDASVIRKSLYEIKGIKSVKVSLKYKKITLTHNSNINILDIKKSINNLGYKYIGVE